MYYSALYFRKMVHESYIKNTEQAPKWVGETRKTKTTIKGVNLKIHLFGLKKTLLFARVPGGGEIKYSMQLRVG